MDNNTKQEYPKWMYGPNGEAEIFEREEDVPADYKDHPAKFKKGKEAKNDAVASESGSQNPEATAPVAASEEKKEKSQKELKDEAKALGLEVKGNPSKVKLQEMIDRAKEVQPQTEGTPVVDNGDGTVTPIKDGEASQAPGTPSEDAPKE